MKNIVKNNYIASFNEATGGLKLFADPLDADGMNWVEGARTFGEIYRGTLQSCIVRNVSACAKNGGEEAAVMQSVYLTKHLKITVTRTAGSTYKERYVFENATADDVFFSRGAAGIYVTLNDSYEAASVCMKRHCTAHVWCGGETSYINAVKMGEYPRSLALILTEGAIDSYGVERDLSQISNDRGDFILYLPPFHLKKGESTAIAFEMRFYPYGNDSFKALLSEKNVPVVEAENYTLIQGEIIEFTVNRPDAKVRLLSFAAAQNFGGAQCAPGGTRGAQTENAAINPATNAAKNTGTPKSLHTESKNGKTYVTYVPEAAGEYVFAIEAAGKRAKAEFFVQIPLDRLIENRVKFIIEKQQFSSAGDPLDGAYMIYDNQDKCLVYDELFPDYNASRERLVMGLLVAKYLQYRPDDRAARESLMRYYGFVRREFFDEESGVVYNAAGKNPKAKRLYNAPWMSVFMMEMYKATGDRAYLERMVRLLRVYYSVGGENFYPNGLSLFETVTVLRQAGMAAEAAEIRSYYKTHVENIVKNGTNYPEHEVRYEQTIVTPAVMMLAQYYMLTGDKKLVEECRRHVRVLERFNGDQPSHYLNEISMRHWDGYWFGKCMIYGDTLPHSASVHTSDAFLHYARISGDETYRKRAVRGARNVLSLFRADGSASTSYLYPLTCNGTRCEFYDYFANEQDGYLYFLIKFFGALGGNEAL